MRSKLFAGGVMVMVIAASVTSAWSQTVPTESAKTSYSPPRTPWGDPDLQGVWPSTHMVGVPFERPPLFGDRPFLTDEEFKARQAEAAHQAQLDVAEFNIDKPSADIVAMGDVGGPTSPPPHWLERGEPSRQSSLIVEPKNGMLPPMTPEGKARQKLAVSTYTQYTGFTKPSELGPYDRCISRGVISSMMPVIYNNGNEIVQAPGYVVLRNEMIHEARVIPLDGSPYLPPTFTSYMGDSRGHWEGNTLVVATKNLNGKTGAQANGNLLLTSDALQLVERFTRTGPDTMRYQVTVNDPKTWTSSWTVSFPLRRDAKYQIFEYACHEGNYAMRNTLSGSRADEQNAPKEGQK